MRAPTPTIRLLEALRAGMPLEDAAVVAGLPPSMALAVAGSPLAKALSGQGPTLAVEHSLGEG